MNTLRIFLLLITCCKLKSRNVICAKAGISIMLQIFGRFPVKLGMTHLFIFIIYSTNISAQNPGKFNLGSAPTPEEIAAWDKDVKPNGDGLPPGEGSVLKGLEIYNLKCIGCHGYEGQYGPYDQLVGRDSGKDFDFGIDRNLKRTVGNYWPYATTLFDYIQRAMPQLEPGSLNPDEVYSLVAYILNLNKVVPNDAVMNATTLPTVEMPAKKKFFMNE